MTDLTRREFLEKSLKIGGGGFGVAASGFSSHDCRGEPIPKRAATRGMMGYIPCALKTARRGAARDQEKTRFD